jgi:hypothetical protein
MLNMKNKIILREKDQLGLAQNDLNEPEDPMEHLLLNVMFDMVKVRGNGNSVD